MFGSFVWVNAFVLFIRSLGFIHLASFVWFYLFGSFVLFICFIGSVHWLCLLAQFLCLFDPFIHSVHLFLALFVSMSTPDIL